MTIIEPSLLMPLPAVPSLSELKVLPVTVVVPKFSIPPPKEVALSPLKMLSVRVASAEVVLNKRAATEAVADAAAMPAAPPWARLLPTVRFSRRSSSPRYSKGHPPGRRRRWRPTHLDHPGPVVEDPAPITLTTVTVLVGFMLLMPPPTPSPPFGARPPLWLPRAEL